MFNYPYLIELLSPKRSTDDQVEALLDRFAERYRRIIGKDKSVEMLHDLNIAIVVEAWMSKNIDLLYRSVGKNKDEKAEKYDPVENLKALHKFYPQCSVYLSMLSFKQEWHEILPKL